MKKTVQEQALVQFPCDDDNVIDDINAYKRKIFISGYDYFKYGFPKIVCLCGSTRFMEAFQRENLKQTLAGNIVLSVGTNTKSDADLTRERYMNDPEIKIRLDELHKRKIDISDEVIILNVGGYIGESTQSELNYAISRNIPVTYLEP